jgi:hypothetical protein
MPTCRAIALSAGLLWAVPAACQPQAPHPGPRAGLLPAAAMPNVLTLPALRPPLGPGVQLPPPIPLPLSLAPLPQAPPVSPPLSAQAAAAAAASLRLDMAREVGGLLRLSPGRPQQIEARARAMLAATNTNLDAPQLVVTVDRAPNVQTLALMMAQPGNTPWTLIGAVHVSTGQAGRKDYYITPVGVFAHTAAILDFRAEGTYNEHHVRGLGLAGMRVWDFGWQWALKGWHKDGAGGDIRLQMHATDPVLLEPRLGRPASEGCVRVSSAMNRFLDGHGVLDADIERAAVDDPRYRALLRPDRTPSPLAGRLLIVIDDRDSPAEPPTQASRPADWPVPPATGAGAAGSL